MSYVSSRLALHDAHCEGSCGGTLATLTGEPPRRAVVTDPDALEAAKERLYATNDPFCPVCGYAIDAHLETDTSDGPIRDTCPSEAEARAHYGNR